MKKLFVLALSALLAVSLCAIFVNAAETNVAKGKTYTYTGAYTDTNGVALYPDKGGVLTDGTAAKAETDLGYDKACWVGMNTNAKNLTDSKKFEIVVDLGSSVSGLTKFTVNTQTCAGGVTAPKEVEIQVSADNKTFTSAGKTTNATKIYNGSKGDDASKDYGIYEYAISTTSQTAKYVKYVITFSTSWCFVSEVAAITGAEPATSTPGTSSVAQSVASSTAASSTAASSTAASKATASSAAPSNAASTAASSEGGDGLSTGAIIGIAAAAVVVIGVIVFVVVKKKKD